MIKLSLFLVFIICLLVTSAGVLLASDPVASVARDDLWPTKGWATASPASVGLDEQILNAYRY